MGVVLYKIGTNHTINGWECDKQIFDPEYLNLNARLAQGWYLTPDCGRTKEAPVTVEVPEPKEPELEVKENGVQAEKQIPEKKAKKPKKQVKRKIKKQILLEFPLTRELIANSLTYQLRAYGKEYKIKNYARIPRSQLMSLLLQKIGETDVQDRSDQQCIQSA